METFPRRHHLTQWERKVIVTLEEGVRRFPKKPFAKRWMRRDLPHGKSRIQSQNRNAGTVRQER